MFSNSPTVRKIVYGLAIAAQIAAYFVRALVPEQAALGDAFSDTANLLAAVAGVTALSNIDNGQLTPSQLEADYQARHARDTIAGI